MRLNKIIVALSAAATLLSLPVLAHTQGDIVVRVGATNVTPSSDKSTIFAVGNNTVDLGAGALTASVDNDTQLGVNLVYFMTNQFAVELLAATPFSHDINVHSGDTTLSLGQTKHLPPTLSALYYFNEPSAKFQPYIGVGINYPVFFEEKFTNPALSGSDSPKITMLGETDLQGNGPTLDLASLKLKNSWGLAAQIGADYQLGDKWLVNASVRFIDIDSTGTFTAAGGTVPGKVDVSIDPWVYTLSIGYKF